jgi:response regulator RpfG family c-di-GMP phosphodiesterase
VRVVVVDDDESMRAMCADTLERAGYTIVGRAEDGEHAVQLVEETMPDVVVMDVEMPRLNGPAATRRIVNAHPEVRVVALTGHTESESITRMIVAGAVGYAVKGTDPDAMRLAVDNAVGGEGHVDASAVVGLFESVVILAREERERRAEAERLAQELEQSYEETVLALVSALRMRDLGTEQHGDRVRQRVWGVGVRLGLQGQELRDLELGAAFHDIGKIAIPDSILQNTDELTPEEWDIVKQHTIAGEQIISPVGFLKQVANIVRHSHEHWDGSGYPDGLAGKDIPLQSRIVFVCDAYDAMTSERSYQDALDEDAARARMKELSGIRFDPEVVTALLEVIDAERAATV